MGGVLARENQQILKELTRTPCGESVDKGSQVIEVAGESVHVVHNHRVPVAGEPQQLGQLRPVCVPAGGLVREYAVQNLAFELAFLVLVQRAHAYISDPLSSHRCLQPHPVRLSSRPLSEEVKACGPRSSGLGVAEADNTGSNALVNVLLFTGVRISEALNANTASYSHDAGHRRLSIQRKGGKTAKVAGPAPAVSTR